ncbi:MAG TPA: adenylate/guanylate cyclase domain-containing protein [Dongiaceae bacterium]|jgi:adenylate cyclase|nr:adenylate/guanylate cyclase domain-containing protein [Dongiaceae bacterium]
MSVHRNDVEAAVLLADVVGSTPLYESLGDAAAMSRIDTWREGMRALICGNGGEFISSKGDDVLSIFEEPRGAFAAVSQMRVPGSFSVAFHAGLHFGRVVRVGGDVYGDAVNLTARLAAVANPGEVLISQSLVDLLSPADKQTLGFLDRMMFKGKSEPCNIYTFLDDDRTLNTEVSLGKRDQSEVPDASMRSICVTLRCNDQMKSCRDGESLTIGRSDECDLIVKRQWVSRHHATITLANGRVRLVERSSSGTFISMQPGQEILVRREDVLLLGSGTISPGMQGTSSDAQIIHFEVVIS